VTLPPRARAHHLVDAVLGERRDQARKVAVVLGDRVGLPELPDLRVLIGIDRTPEQVEDAVARHQAAFYQRRRYVR
jgi:hypothetical protein